jgi:hypothetical protein
MGNNSHVSILSGATDREKRKISSGKVLVEGLADVRKWNHAGSRHTQICTQERSQLCLDTCESLIRMKLGLNV